MHHQLRAARRVDVGALSKALDAALAKVESRGAGLYRVIDGRGAADAIADTLRSRGIVVARHANGTLGIAPALDRAEEQIEALGRALASIS